MWAAQRARLDSQVRPQRWGIQRGGLVGVSLVVAFVGGLLWARRPAPSGWANLETRAGVTAMQLREGSRLILGPETALQVQQDVEQQVELALERGRVDCDVVSNPARSFSVAAAGYRVVVRGTRFSVDLSRKDELSVDVERGRVEVRRSSATVPEAVLETGGHWSVQLQTEAAPARLPPKEPSSAPQPAPAAPAVTQPSADAVVVAPAESRAARTVTPASSHGAVARREAAQGGARLLLDQGNAARRRGDLTAAARAYQTLLAEYAEDARAGLAAFELGRLRMDQFGDLPGAITALQLAAQSLTDKGLREDAMARLVRAFERSQDLERCRAAREAYLEAYPVGTHVVAIAQACSIK